MGAELSDNTRLLFQVAKNLLGNLLYNNKSHNLFFLRDFRWLQKTKDYLCILTCTHFQGTALLCKFLSVVTHVITDVITGPSAKGRDFSVPHECTFLPRTFAFKIWDPDKCL